MKNYQMEVSVWHKDYLEDRLGSTHIPWSYVFIDFLNRLHRKEELCNVSASGEYNIFDEVTSKRMASIKLNIKLTYLKDKFTSEFRSLSEGNQKTFMYTGFDSKPTTILSTVKENPRTPLNILEETGIIKTLYRGANKKTKKLNSLKSPATHDNVTEKDQPEDKPIINNMKDKVTDNSNHYPSVKNILTPVRSDTDVDKCKQIELIKSKSCTTVNRDQYNILNYIFGGNNGPFGNSVYCVGYFTVENDFDKDPNSSKASVKQLSSEGKSEESKEKYKFRICDSECPSRKDGDNTCSQSVCSLDLPAEAANLINITKCKQVECNNRKHKEVPSPPDDRILLDMSNLNKECCGITEKIEEVVGGMKAKMKFGDQPCFCSCECTFGFTKKTTYCTVCGGYEITGDDMPTKPTENTTFPCPIYHKLIDKNKLKTWSTSGSDSKKKPEESQKSFKGGSKSAGSDKRSIADKSAESEKESKKGKKKKKDDRFKFNYGYQAPQIGHSQCTFPCTGTLGVVPKHMGWLWTAEDVPGMKFRPMWKPGATNKHVVRLLKMAKHPGQVITKKKKKDATKKKRPIQRPLLVVQKKEGEYTITMETMKAYAKPRAINQIPFEDKLPLTYTIGRSEEENRERQKRKEREQRRQERAQRQFIQSAFRDVCRDICLKTYQQALGLLPDAENPECPCYPAQPDAEHTNLDVSCSCSEAKSSIGSDTDSDEWIVEFTPPNAMFNPTFKGKKVIKTDNSSQYTYLDYKVKLIDRHGNPVPRFFKGLDGKQQCSDLGGFWSPEHKWLEINVDGYVAPDGRWAPNAFIGPNGEQIDTDTGKFQVTGGKWLVVGIDGYIDSQGRWKFYSRPRDTSPQKGKGVGGRKGAGLKLDYKKSETTWSCFGDITPRQLSKMGIVGHGQDKKLLLAALKNILATGEDVKIPEPSVVPRLAPSKKQKRPGKHQPGTPGVYDSRTYFQERHKCRHPVPPEKGVISVDARGRKTYFKLKDYKNKRPDERINALKDYGISLSDFHEPCFHSFIDSETLRQQHLERYMTKTKCASTQIG
ncbi:uncharacterized protein LOC115451786 [Manduca sexta]|uniref:uncharacterized protein LOC115451786 n=1 Tax=Manduca sexta TaxID=7130 RepID=UPI00188DE959|nr:uncharacterized protein LOC115451786 [Manduca sexta]